MLPNAERELYIRGQILERRLPDDVMGRRAAKSLRAEGGSMAVGNISTLYLTTKKRLICNKGSLEFYSLHCPYPRAFKKDYLPPLESKCIVETLCCFLKSFHMEI